MSNKQDRPVKVEVKVGYSRPLIAGALITVLGGLAGCSAVPDAVNPAEWYKSTVDFFAGEDGEGQVSQAEAGQEKPIPGEDKPFPKLSTVPERPSAPVQGGLVADIDKRKYAQPIARQGGATEILAAQPPAPAPAPSEVASAPVVSPVQPAPPAMPAAPVVQAPVSMPSIPAFSSPMPSGAAPMPTPPDAGYASIVPNAITLTPPPTAPSMPANAMASIDEDPYGTVVVSSMGIEMAANAPAAALAPAPSIAPVNDAPSIANSLNRLSQGTAGGVKVATIMFETGSSGLSRNDRMILGEVVRLHQQRGGTVTVVGHASSRTRNMDPVRHKMVNYNVSVDRADRIAKELRAMGMDPDMIVVDARADNMPLYYESMPSGEAGNRRAEIYFQK